ncbi:hypothetical protein MMM7_12200 [Helicobacter pylori]
MGARTIRDIERLKYSTQFREREKNFLEKKLECGGISTIRKDKNNELFYIVETNGKKVFCHSSQCKESVNRDELSQGVQVCLEMWSDNKDPSKVNIKVKFMVWKKIKKLFY